MKIKKLFRVAGYLFFVGAVIFPLAFSSVVTGTKDESFSRDLLGFPIPHPPSWVSLIPYLGWSLGIIFELFSLHGLVTIGISVLLISFGVFLVNLGQ